MLINVAGTNGSGKSTVVRAVMAACSVTPLVDERGRERGYSLELDGARLAEVMGRYTEGVGTGGCDTIKDIEGAYEAIALAHERGTSVLYEGIRMMNHMRTVALQKRTRSLTVVLLTTSFEETMRRIRARQEAVGRVHDVVEKDIRGNINRARNCAAKARQHGATVVECSSNEAPARIVEMLRGGR